MQSVYYFTNVQLLHNPPFSDGADFATELFQLRQGSVFLAPAKGIMYDWHMNTLVHIS